MTVNGDEASSSGRSTTAFVGLCALGSSLLVTGGCSNIIAMNTWEHFTAPGGGGPFTVLIASITFILTFFTIILGVWIAIKRPALRFVLDRKGMLLIVVASFFNALDSIMMVYAAEHCPEFLQVSLTSTPVFYTIVIARLLRVEPPLRQPMLLAAVALLVVAGVLMNGSTALSSAKGDGLSRTQIVWSVVFGAAQLFQAVYNVLLGVYLRRHVAGLLPTAPVINDDDERRLLLHSSDAETSEAVRAQTRDEISRGGGMRGFAPDADTPVTDSTTATLLLLAATTFFLLVFVAMFFPLDSTPGFGTSKDVAATWVNLQTGWRCIFGHQVPGDTCGWRWTGLSCFAFSGGTALMNAGIAVLNRVSAPFAALVMQLMPSAAIIALMLFPALNVAQQSYSVGLSLGACACLVVSAALYYRYVRQRLSLLQASTRPDGGEVLLEDA